MRAGVAGLVLLLAAACAEPSASCRVPLADDASVLTVDLRTGARVGATPVPHAAEVQAPAPTDLGTHAGTRLTLNADGQLRGTRASDALPLWNARLERQWVSVAGLLSGDRVLTLATRYPGGDLTATPAVVAAALDAGTGAMRWQRVLRAARAARSGRLVVDGDKLLVVEGRQLQALGLVDGAPRWSVDLPYAELREVVVRGDRVEVTSQEPQIGCD